MYEPREISYLPELCQIKTGEHFPKGSPKKGERLSKKNEKSPFKGEKNTATRAAYFATNTGEALITSNAYGDFNISTTR